MKAGMGRVVLGLLGALVLASCGAKRPVLYPNTHLEQVGSEVAQADIDDCIRFAEEYGVAGGSGEAGKAARRTATGSAIGAATGAAAGAVGGHAGRGAAAGAAGGATAGFLSWVFGSRQPDPTFQRFVEKCLADKGYQTIGWK